MSHIRMMVEYARASSCCRGYYVCMHCTCRPSSFSVFAMPLAPVVALTGSLPRTSLQRVGETEYVATLIAKARPPRWKVSSLVLRFVEANGAQAVFTVSGDALDGFERCEVYKTYRLVVSAACVKRTNKNEKFGVPSELEVLVRSKATFPVAASSPAVGLGMIYHFRDWDTFDQIPVGECFDLVGEVLQKLHREMRGSVVKVVISLGNRNLRQDINVFGDDVLRLQLEVGDVLAISGVRVEEYRSQRMLGLGLLPVIQRNPVLKNGDRVVWIEDDGPVRKAMRTSQRTPIPISEAVALSLRILEESGGVDVSGLPQRHECSLVGRFDALGEAFFDLDPPIVKEDILLLPRVLCDDSGGKISVKLWRRACTELFGMDAKAMREVWEKGHLQEEERAGILQKLNASLGRRVSCMCSIEAVKLGRQQLSQVSVNALDFLD